MALRDQPYLPLYVQDFLTDEKLIECTSSATGIYIRLMCIMHKSDEYGVVLLKQKDKQTDNQVKNFALKLAKQMPYSIDEIFNGLNELISEGVIQLNCETLSQKRMIKDNEISLIRSKAGKKGGDNNPFAQAKTKAKSQANTEYEYENEDILIKKGVKFKKPLIEEVRSYCLERKNKVDFNKWYDFYESKGWMIGKNKMKDWKAAIRTWEDKNNNTSFTSTNLITNESEIS